MHLKHGVALPPDKQLTYSCSICGMGYIYEKNYKRHLQKHESGELNELGNEKHSCDICGNVYAHKFTLIVHLREKHGESGEIVIKKKKSIWKPYKCQFCQMPFRRYMSLYSHQVREHPETRVDISSPSSLSYLLSLHTLLSNQSSTQKKDSKEKKPSFLIKDIIDIDG
ncbi:hypothetical protein GCK72_009257 [Caenorhabditis remanei]|uniref:C2H2-type domain-containing protein n=1 Tax=Caenorhabditis remanei TaxID=31234 RepID=A0A6A5H2J2_CAERE|nr:hypothetical protein GCK72_009257 [Caenorhabditis remanei]KAF1761004.1 hypothetical protein GCK72_009257 [Caenorhabditis remanei]